MRFHPIIDSVKKEVSLAFCKKQVENNKCTQELQKQIRKNVYIIPQDQRCPNKEMSIQLPRTSRAWSLPKSVTTPLKTC